MQWLRTWIPALAVAALFGRAEQSRPTAVETAALADTIINLERGALDRWGKGDPQGYVELFAPEVTYFDPFAEKRIDGVAAMREMLKPITGKVKVDRYDMLNPKVQRFGDIAVLSFNLVSHARRPDGTPYTVRWNTTEVYRRVSGSWRIMHSHFSYTKPEVRPPA